MHRLGLWRRPGQRPYERANPPENSPTQQQVKGENRPLVVVVPDEGHDGRGKVRHQQDEESNPGATACKHDDRWHVDAPFRLSISEPIAPGGSGAGRATPNYRTR